MVVQHNMQAMNANRMLNVTTGNQSKSTEKLSSGYKINRAADDAAGLTISEKMRKQMKGLDRASTNAEDGVSAVQTAEGALTEVHSMLQRMNELAVQAANGTNSEADREAIQNEISQLTTEIDRVAETTKFNEIYLLKGNPDGTSSNMTIAAHDAGLDGKLTDNGDTATFALNKALENGDKITIAGSEYEIGSKATADSTDGFGLYADVKDTTLKAGDSITYDNAGTEKTAVMVEKVLNDDAGALANNNTVFVVADDQGHEKTYTIATASADKGDGKADIKKDEAAKLIADELAKGHSVTMTKYNDGSATKDVNWAIVDSLEDSEIAANVWTATATDTVDELVKGTVAANGPLGKTDADVKSVTLGGESTTITKHNPVSSKDIAEVIGKLKAGDKITVYPDGDITSANALEVTIADTTDAKLKEYTVEDALKLINVEKSAIDSVEIYAQTANKEAVKALEEKGITNSVAVFDGTKAVSVVGSPAGNEQTNGKILTVNEAYEMITKELQNASSIGTDTGKEAMVTSKGDGTFVITKGQAEVKDALSFSLHVGADADMTNKISVDVEAMSAAGLGIKGLNVTDKSGTSATYAIDAIADAIAKVSEQRSSLGAVQNRLEHTIANLDNVVENTTAAESRIRDTDMAEEMVEYSKNNILAQAGQSMLAQANQANQGVLSLLG